jgi:hypothetical protein
MSLTALPRNFCTCQGGAQKRRFRGHCVLGRDAAGTPAKAKGFVSPREMNGFATPA